MPRQLATSAAPAGLPGMAQPPIISSAGEDLQRRLDRLTESQAGFAARVRRLDDDGPVVPHTLRDALAEFSRELDELRADLDGLCEEVVAPAPRPDAMTARRLRPFSGASPGPHGMSALGRTADSGRFVQLRIQRADTAMHKQGPALMAPLADAIEFDLMLTPIVRPSHLLPTAHPAPPRRTRPTR